jgi:hypothetical protein
MMKWIRTRRMSIVIARNQWLHLFEGLGFGVQVKGKVLRAQGAGFRV